MEDGGHLHELLEALESGVLSLERDRARDPATAVHRMFQSAHNLKSGLAMAGLSRASTLLHHLENGLDEIRRGRRSWSTAWADGLLEAVDRVKACIDEGADDELDMGFEAPRENKNALSPSSPPSSPSPEAESSPVLRSYRIEKLFLPGLSREEFEGHLIYEDIAASGTLVSVTPGWEGYAAATDELVVRFSFTSTQTPEQLAELFFDPLIEGPSPASSPRFRLLVIEDDGLSASLVNQAVAPWADVELTADGRQGVQAFARAWEAGKPFDVVVCDLEMPEVDGHTALQLIREEEDARGVGGLDRCLVFMNTSSRDFAHVSRSFKLQADAYFIKPLSVTKIQKKLEQSLPWLQTRRRDQGWK